jgi:hypothetical protein
MDNNIHVPTGRTKQYARTKERTTNNISRLAIESLTFSHRERYQISTQQERSLWKNKNAKTIRNFIQTNNR